MQRQVRSRVTGPGSLEQEEDAEQHMDALDGKRGRTGIEQTAAVTGPYLFLWRLEGNQRESPSIQPESASRFCPSALRLRSHTHRQLLCA